MDQTTKQQFDLIEKVARRYKENGGYIYMYEGSRKVRVSLADFILTEVPALRKYLARTAVKQSLTTPTRKKSLQVRSALEAKP